MSLKTSSLGEICELIKTGKTPPTQNKEYFDGDILWFTPGDLDTSKELNSSNRTITRAAVADKKAIIYPENTLLVSCIGEIGKLGIARGECSSNQQITAFKPKSFINVDFLYYWFKANKSLIAEKGNNAVVPIINNGTLKQIKISFPPLEEQKRIAEVLDKADRLCQKDRLLLEKYDELLQSVFLDLFGDPVKNEKGWEVKLSSSIITNIQSGTSYGGEERKLTAEELGVLKVSAVTSGEFKAEEYKAVPKSLINKKIIHPKKGDLLFSRANTRELVAATCIVDKDYPELFLPDKLWRIDLELSKCNPVYFKHLLSQKEFRYELTKTATGTSGSMLNISMDKLRTLLVPLPPIETQNLFAIIYNKVALLKEKTSSSKTASEYLFKSLLQKSFKGELELKEAKELNLA
jgi:type I restriction enzyme, S subunit